MNLLPPSSFLHFLGELMKQTTAALLFFILHPSSFILFLGGCVSTGNNPEEMGPPQPNPGQIGCYGGGGTRPMVPGVQGPWGNPFPMAAPYSMAPPQGEADARA